MVSANESLIITAAAEETAKRQLEELDKKFEEMPEGKALPKLREVVEVLKREDEDSLMHFVANYEAYLRFIGGVGLTEEAEKLHSSTYMDHAKLRTLLERREEEYFKDIKTELDKRENRFSIVVGEPLEHFLGNIGRFIEEIKGYKGVTAKDEALTKDIEARLKKIEDHLKAYLGVRNDLLKWFRIINEEFKAGKWGPGSNFIEKWPAELKKLVDYLDKYGYKKRAHQLRFLQKKENIENIERTIEVVDKLIRLMEDQTNINHWEEEAVNELKKVVDKKIEQIRHITEHTKSRIRNEFQRKIEEIEKGKAKEYNDLRKDIKRVNRLETDIGVAETRLIEAQNQVLQDLSLLSGKEGLQGQVSALLDYLRKLASLDPKDPKTTRTWAEVNAEEISARIKMLNARANEINDRVTPLLKEDGEIQKLVTLLEKRMQKNGDKSNRIAAHLDPKIFSEEQARLARLLTEEPNLS